MSEIRKLRSPNLWLTIFAAANDAMLLVDDRFVIRACNPRAQELYGYSEEELIGKSLFELRTPEAGANLAAQLLEARRRGGMVYETAHRRQDGSSLQVEVSTRPLKLGHRHGWVHVVRDISERKRSEEERERLLQSEQLARAAAERAQDRLAFLAEASVILASSLDYETTLSQVARLAVPRIADWCSIEVCDEEGRLRLVELTHTDSAKAQWARELREREPLDPDSPFGAHHVVRTGLSEFYSEISEEFLAGTPVNQARLARAREMGLTSAMIAPLIAGGPQALGAMTFVSAESGRRYTHNDLALAEELARRAALAIENARHYRKSQEAVQARDLFLSVASHELKTPLTIIQGYAELLKRQVETAAAVPSGEAGGNEVRVPRAQLLRRVENVYSAAGRLTTLINELLDVNRMQRGAIELNRERMDLVALLSTVIQNALARDQVAERSRGIRILTDCPSFPVWGTWDQSRIEQVLVNLVDNAVKYSPPGETVQVTLRLEPSEGGAEQAHLIVQDHGIGIPKEEIARIFQPFMRGTNAARLRYPGLGLGLAISREIVEHHGGRIWVESAGANQGTTFHLILRGVEPGGQK